MVLKRPFVRHIRIYNSAVEFKSFAGIERDISGEGQYCFKTRDQIYRYISLASKFVWWNSKAQHINVFIQFYELQKNIIFIHKLMCMFFSFSTGKYSLLIVSRSKRTEKYFVGCRPPISTSHFRRADIKCAKRTAY